MKRFNKLNKGILAVLALVLLMNFGSSFALQSNFLVNDAFAAQDDVPVEDILEDPDALSEDGGDGESQTALEVIENAPPLVETPIATKSFQEILDDVTVKAAKAHYIFAPLINFASFQIGNFLGNDYVYEGAMGEILQKIWVISRNLVNIVFVFILLWLAIRIIIFPDATWDDLKKKLLIFTLLLVGVNFSWLATKVVLDSANVVTHVVFAIPSGISNPPTFEPCRVNNKPGVDEPVLQGVCYPTTILAPVDAGSNPPLYFQDKEGNDDECAGLKERYYGESDSAYDANDKPNPIASAENKELQKRVSICMESLNLFKYNKNTAVVYLTYGMARIQNLTTTTKNSGDIVKIATSLIVPVAIQTAYAIALLALLFALVVRMMMLWILVGFSPILVLMIWFKDGESLGGVKKYFSIEQFVNWAFVPAKVGVIFVITFIMISAGQNMGDALISTTDTNGAVFTIFNQRSLFAGIDSLQYFIWLLMSLAVLWMGTFAVLGSLGVVGGILTTVGNVGQTFAKQVATLPYWAPILPIGKNGEKASLRSAVQAINPISLTNEKYLKANSRGIGNTVHLTDKAKKLDSARVNGMIDGKNMEMSDANHIASTLGHTDLHTLFTREVPEAIKAALKSNRDIRDPEGIFAEMNRLHESGGSAAANRTQLKKETDAVARGTETGAKAANASVKRPQVDNPNSTLPGGGTT